MLQPKERLTPLQWAEKYRYVGKGTSPLASNGRIRYSSAAAPHQIKPQQSFTDPSVQATVLLMASQIGGKTEMILNLVGYFMHQKPVDMVIMYPTIESAELFSKKKLNRAIKATPVLLDVCGNSTLRVKEFLGGSAYLVGANSPPSLRGTNGEVLIADEIDAYVGTSEGDPLELLWKRGEAYSTLVKVLSSTPTLKGLSRIEKAFAESDQEFWFVPCVKCGFYQTYKWAQVKWPDGRPMEAVYICEKCAAALTDKQRVDMYFNGEWRATAPFNGVMGFHLNGIYSPWPAHSGFKDKLHEMAEDAIRAKRGGPQTLKVWVNTFLCESWEDESESVPEIETLLARAEDYPADHLPHGVCMLIAQGDVQGDRIEVEIDGWGIGEERWKIARQTFAGNPEQSYIWERVDEFLSKTHKLEGGQELSVAFALFDRRHKGKAVDAFTKKNNPRGWFSCQGGASATLPVVSGPKKSGVTKAYVYTLGTFEAKGIIYSRLHIETPGPRYTHFPKGRGFDHDYFRQLTSERLVTEIGKNGPKKAWKKIHNRNEGLDLSVYGLAAMIARRPNFEAIAKNLAKSCNSGSLGEVIVERSISNAPKEQLPDDAKPKPAQAAPQGRRPGGPPKAGFVHGWRRF